MRAQLVTISVNGKMVKRFYSVKERGQFERPFFYSKDMLKLQIDFDTENERVILLLDGIEYE